VIPLYAVAIFPYAPGLSREMSAMGHSLPRHPVPVAANVRYASNSDQI